MDRSSESFREAVKDTENIGDEDFKSYLINEKYDIQMRLNELRSIRRKTINPLKIIYITYQRAQLKQLADAYKELNEPAMLARFISNASALTTFTGKSTWFLAKVAVVWTGVYAGLYYSFHAANLPEGLVRPELTSPVKIYGEEEIQSLDFTPKAIQTMDGKPITSESDIALDIEKVEAQAAAEDVQ